MTGAVTPSSPLRFFAGIHEETVNELEASAPAANRIFVNAVFATICHARGLDPSPILGLGGGSGGRLRRPVAVHGAQKGFQTA